MIGSKSVAWVIAVMALAGVYGLTLNEARAEDVPEPIVPQESATPDASETAKPSRPRSPIKIETIDYQDPTGGSGKPGKLKLAGTAKPGTMVYLFVDLDPYGRVIADDAGKWTLEGDLELDDQPHRVRAEQYDPETRMLAGRAMVTFSRNKTNAGP